MEEIEIKRENEEEGETIYEHREYNVKNENSEYILRLEINEKNLGIVISSNDNINYNYKTQMSLLTIVNKLKLNSAKYCNLELILNLFDKIYESKTLTINTNNNDESCRLLIKSLNVFGENDYEIILYKHYMKFDDKFNMLYNQFKLLKKINNDNLNIIEMNNQKINELNIKLEKRDEEIRDILNKKDLIINEMNTKIINQENRIKELENNNINIFQENKKLNELFNNKENEAKELNEKISNLENDLNNINNNLIKINEIIANINALKKDINQLNNIVKQNDKKINDNDIELNQKMNNKLKEEINRIENNFNIKFREQENINDKKSNIILFDNKRYEYKINYEFKKDPKNLKFKDNITITNTPAGWNDIFEIFISYKDNKEYLVSPNCNNYKLDIYSLFDNKKINSLSGHNNKIRTIRYFMNDKDKNEYLISADDNKIVIIWDITNNFNIKHKINTKYGKEIYSCLLIFPKNSEDNYIITSTFNDSGKDEDSASKLYSLSNGNQIKCFNNTNNNSIFYLLSWYNNIDNKYYVIQFSFEKIIINSLLEDELYAELSNEPENNHFSGCLYTKNDNDYLLSSSSNGYINIWDLYNKKIYKTINTNGCELAHIIEWNKKYIIVADYNNKSFKIINIDDGSIYNINTEHKDKLKCIKKVNHPIYGESLLTAANDKTIKLWTIE